MLAARHPEVEVVEDEHGDADVATGGIDEVAASAGGHCSWRTRWTINARILGVVFALRWTFTRGLLSEGTGCLVTPILSKEPRVNNVIRNHS